MKKFKLFIIGLILLFISLVFSKELTIYQITPCLLLPWVIYISIYLEYPICLSYTFFFSVANDLLDPQRLGFSTILLVLISHFTFKYNENLNKDKYYTIAFSLLLINVVFYFFQFCYLIFTSSAYMFLIQKTLFSILYNTFFSCVIIFLINLLNRLKIVLYE